MAKYSKARSLFNAVTAFCAFCLTLLIGVGQAQAAEIGISGMDYYLGGADTAGNGEVGILTVTGSPEDAVYVNVESDDALIASHLKFSLEGGEEQGDGQVVGVVSANISDFGLDGTYSIEVYADHEENVLLYAGSISPVYATIKDMGDQPLGIRTIGTQPNEAGRQFQAPAFFMVGEKMYALDKQVDDAHYAYVPAEESDAVLGSITYVDDEGNILKSKEIANISAEGTTVTIPPVITVGSGEDAAYWRTICLTGAVTAKLPGTINFVIPCKPLSTDDMADNGFYLARINMMGNDDKLLATDTLNVTGPYLYTPPTRLHQTDENGIVITYELSDEKELLNTYGALELEPNKQVVDGVRSFDITYDRVTGEAGAPWTIMLVNGAADPKSADRIIDQFTIMVPAGEIGVFPNEEHKLEPTLEVNGTKMNLVGGEKAASAEYTYEYGKKGSKPVLTFYYVPEGYEVHDPYKITVRYANIADNSVIKSREEEVTLADRDMFEITSEPSFVQDGIEWVRLAGQEESIFHSYYSSNRTYTIWYRDINDLANADVTITRTEVEYETRYNYIDGGTRYTEVDGGTRYVDGGTRYIDGEDTFTDNGTTTRDNGMTYTDGGTTYVDGGTTTTNGGTTTTDGGTTTTGAGGANATAGNGASTASIPAQDGLNVINGNGSAIVTDGQGRDTNTMRIEDDATPLAGPGSSQAASSMSDAGRIGASLAALATLVGLLFFFFMKRKKDDEDESDDETAA